MREKEYNNAIYDFFCKGAGKWWCGIKKPGFPFKGARPGRVIDLGLSLLRPHACEFRVAVHPARHEGAGSFDFIIHFLCKPDGFHGHLFFNVYTT